MIQGNPMQKNGMWTKEQEIWGSSMSIRGHQPEDDTDKEHKDNDPDLLSFSFHDRMLNACSYAYDVEAKTDETS